MIRFLFRQSNLTEMKAFGSPPAAVVNVTSAVMCLLAPKGKVPKDRSWKNAKATIMSKVSHCRVSELIRNSSTNLRI